MSADGTPKRPVMIHRAILGSLERLLGVLIEHTGGHWPFWLSPRQILICAVHPGVHAYAQALHRQLKAQGYYVDVADPGERLNKAIREGRKVGYNYFLVIGDEELAKGTVSIRERIGTDHFSFLLSLTIIWA